MSERESDKQTLAHWIFSVSHLFQCRLLVVNLLVFRHVSLVAEIIKVTGISLGVEFWHERSALGSKGGPINFGEVWVGIDILDGRETL
jgi:hypothetical protein